jgi:pilus assembly protein CpaF
MGERIFAAAKTISQEKLNWDIQLVSKINMKREGKDKVEKEITFAETVQFVRRSETKTSSRFDAATFERAIGLVDYYFNERLQHAHEADKKQILDQQHKATVGFPQEIQAMKAIIEQLVKENGMEQITFPPMYERIVDALYHETWGLGAVSVWYERHGEIGKCRVNGGDVWYRVPGQRHRMHEQFRTLSGVDRLVQNLMRNDEQQVMSRGNEQAQLQMADGTRVTITMPPMVKHPTIAFRRAVVQKYTLDQQVLMETIQGEAQPIYRMLSRCGTKVILTGEPGTGKTTFLVSMYGETKPEKVTVSCESEFEVDLKKKFPDRDITEFQAKHANMESKIIPLTLRQDTGQYIMAEVRETEAPALKEACANTTGWVAATMHENDSTNVPGTLARKELRQSEGMNYRMCLVEYASKIDFVLVMAYGEDESVIRNVEISSLELEPYTLTVTSRRILWFDGEAWRYNGHLDPRLAHRMRRYDRQSYDEGMQALQQLAKKYPIPPEEQAIALTNAT